jgi:hypothetical protein
MAPDGGNTSMAPAVTEAEPGFDIADEDEANRCAQREAGKDADDALKKATALKAATSTAAGHAAHVADADKFARTAAERSQLADKLAQDAADRSQQAQDKLESMLATARTNAATAGAG